LAVGFLRDFEFAYHRPCRRFRACAGAPGRLKLSGYQILIYLRSGCSSGGAAIISPTMIWTAYIDEADTHGAPVLAMGGFVSAKADWAIIDVGSTVPAEALYIERPTYRPWQAFIKTCTQIPHLPCTCERK
jgi:hypothetical protein